MSLLWPPSPLPRPHQPVMGFPEARPSDELKMKGSAMRSSLETSSFRVVLLASGLAIVSAACGSSSGKPNGAGGSSADAGSDLKAGTGGAGTGGKADSGADSGAGGKVDSGADSGAGGNTGAGGMVVDAGVDTGPTLSPPWHAY